MNVVTLLKPHSKDLGGGVVVNRLLPSAQRQAVGPFILFDHFGPVMVEPEAKAGAAGLCEPRPPAVVGLARSP